MKVEIRERNKSKAIQELHAKFLGASEVPVLFDCGYISYQDLIHNKLLNIKQEETLRMRIGSALEKLLFKELKQEFLKEQKLLLWHNDYKIAYTDEDAKIVAIPDFCGEENSRLVMVGDIKTTARDNAKSEKFNIQVQTQIMCSNADFGIVACYNFLKGQLEYEIIYPDSELQKQIKEKAKQFWKDLETYAQQGFYASADCDTENNDEIIVADDLILKAIKDYLSLTDEISFLEKQAKEKKAMIEQSLIGKGKILIDPNGAKLATIIERKTETIDKNKLKLALMERYKEFITEKVSHYVKITGGGE